MRRCKDKLTCGEQDLFFYSEKGFSLVEATIALLIIGLLMVPMVMAYDIHQKSVGKETTEGRFTESLDNINSFVARDKRYPLPASMILPPTDANYGKEFTGVIPACPAGMVSTGICRTGGANPVIIGAIPFDTLGINPDLAHDYWDNRILYAVTESQTAAASYVANGGGQITVRAYDCDGGVIADMPAPRNPNDMILISHGETGKGAYTRLGVNVAACTGPAALDDENCNLDNIFILRENDNPDILVCPGGGPVGTASDVSGANFYDDFTEEQIDVPQTYWVQNLLDSDYAVTMVDRIGVGTKDPAEMLHVRGDVKGDNLLSKDICEGTGTDCFDPEIIGGDVPEMDCNQNTIPGVEAVLVIRQEQVFCASPVDGSGNPVDGLAYEFPSSHFSYITCTPPAVVKGIAGGVPQCGL